MVRPVYAAVLRHGGKLTPRPALIFVPSRRQSRSTAVDMLTMAHADSQPKRFLHINPEEPTFVKLLDAVQVLCFRYIIKTQGVLRVLFILLSAESVALFRS